MKKKLFYSTIFYILFFLSFNVFCSNEKKEILYEISFDNAKHHEAQIKATFTSLSSKPLEIVMSKSSPGYYASLNFAKNIYNVKAYNSKGESLELQQPDAHEWNISKHDGSVIFTYTLFADYLNGTYSSIEINHILLNIPSAFVWARGLENIPIKIKIKKPADNLTIVTQLIQGASPEEFSAPNLAYFIDSPIALAKFDIKEFEVKSNDKIQKIILAIKHNGTENDSEIYAKLAEAITYEQMSIFKELPSFDYGTYSFIAFYLPEAFFDGMEHRNSSVLTSTKTLETNMIKNLRTLSHELFHAWECERIRPKSLTTFNLEKTNISDELWFVEGMPTYFQDLIICRAGLINLDEYGEILKSRLDYVYNYPGSKIHSLVEMSRKATFFNGGSYEDPINKDNIYISYYSYGGVIALALDFELRIKFKNITLDDYMYEIWKKFGKKEIPYTNDDLKNLLSQLTNDEKFANIFFQKYIYGNELPDMEKLLSYAGFTFKRKNPDLASIGRNTIFKYDNKSAIINDNTLANEPLYQAGLDRGDIILKIEDKSITKENDIKNILSGYQPGDTTKIEYKKRNGEIANTKAVLEVNKELSIVPYEMTSLPITNEILNFRKSWLGSKSDFHNPDLVKKDPESERIFPFEFNYCPNTGRKLVIKLKPKINSEISRK